MSIEAGKIVEMLDAMKRLQREQAALAKHNEVSRDWGNTPRRRHAASESARECAIEIRRLTHEAHCIAVEMGIADRRADSYYADSVAPAGFGREFIFTRRVPAATGSASHG
jgi:hypothetical protein